VLEFEKGIFGLSNKRMISIPVNIIKQKDMSAKNASYDYLP
jgi:hypothetical protein